MKRSRNPPFVHEYETQHGTTAYYLRKPGHSKVRLRIPDGCLPWSPSFMAIYEAAMTETPAKPAIGASRTVPGTVNAAMIGYFQSSFGNGVAESTKKAFRAILETFRAEHGDKRVAMMHTTALQNIVNNKKPGGAAQFQEGNARVYLLLHQSKPDDDESTRQYRACENQEDRRPSHLD